VVLAVLLNCTKCGEVKPVDEFHRESRNTLRHFRRTQCKKCDYLKQKKYAEKNRAKISFKDVAYRRMRLLNYPQDLFDERLAQQGNVCAICGTDTPGGRGQFHADHDHKTNQPRGVLCHNCNIALGNFKDNPEILRAAIDYLQRYSEAE
jgi:hypothetical protein